MQIVLLSGDSGKRLWPLSNGVRSEQYLKLLPGDDGSHCSPVQRVYAQIRAVYPNADITIAANQSQVDSIRSQLGENVSIVLEPERRDTFPSIALACAYLAEEKQVGINETIIAMPCDPFTEADFFQTLIKLNEHIAADSADLALIEVGGLRNNGVFAFRLGTVLDIARKDAPFVGFTELLGKYGELENISFYDKVAEKAARVAAVPYQGKWTNIRTWKALADEFPSGSSGTVIQENTNNTFIVNELDIPLVALSTKDLIIAASPDGILVSDMDASSALKSVTDKVESARPMYEERRWGDYTVLAQKSHCLVKNLFIAAGKAISLQAHAHRSEVWVITKGEGSFTLDDETKTVTVGDILKIEIGQKHKMAAVSDLYFTEVQLGDRFDESDIIRFDLSADGVDLK
jgi:mannose-1-phosphate guanylyltransferase